jgi:hypothetical protein
MCENLSWLALPTMAVSQNLETEDLRDCASVRSSLPLAMEVTQPKDVFHKSQMAFVFTKK